MVPRVPPSVVEHAATRARDIVSLHPQAAARYRAKVAELHDALAHGDAASVEAVSMVRELVGEIRNIPRGKAPVALEIVGDLAALMAPEQEANTVMRSLVAGVGNLPAQSKSRIFQAFPILSSGHGVASWCSKIKNP